MKKLVCGLLALGMILSLTACGGKKQSVTYRSEQEQNGLAMVDTMTLDAKGDKVQKMTEVIEIDSSGFDADTQDQLAALYDELVAQYQAVDDVECTGEAGDGSYTIRIVIDATGDAVSQLAEQGLLEVDGDVSGISLNKTAESLEDNGYTLAE